MKARYEAFFKDASGECPEELAVRALVAVHTSYFDAEGPQCSAVNEVVWHLLLPKFRTELRRWCHASAATTIAAELTLKRELVEFLGESV